MSKRKPQSKRRPVGAPAANQQKTSNAGPKQTHGWGKPLAWSGGVATVVLAGVLVNVLSSQAGRIIPQPPPTSGTDSRVSSRPATTAPATRPASSSLVRPSADPLTVVSEDPLNVDSLGNWVFPRSLVLSRAELKKLDNISSFEELNNNSSSFYAIANYLYSLGGYQDGQTETQLVVQNNQSVPLRIIDMGIVKSCTAPLEGTLFSAPAQASDESAKIGFNLDREYPIAVGIPNNSSVPEPPQYYDSTNPYFANYTVSIAPGSQQVFDLFTQVEQHACTFRYKLTVLKGETKVNQIIGDGSEPFRVSGGRWTGSVMYYDGDCNPDPNRGFIRVNPKTFNFSCS